MRRLILFWYFELYERVRSSLTFNLLSLFFLGLPLCVCQALGIFLLLSSHSRLLVFNECRNVSSKKHDIFLAFSTSCVIYIRPRTCLLIFSHTRLLLSYERMENVFFVNQVLYCCSSKVLPHLNVFVSVFSTSNVSSHSFP